MRLATRILGPASGTGGEEAPCMLLVADTEGIRVGSPAEAPPLSGRDHLAYRGSYLPVKNVVDADLCEQFARLPPAALGEFEVALLLEHRGPHHLEGVEESREEAAEKLRFPTKGVALPQVVWLKGVLTSSS